jgi:hypothetical protein
MQTERNPDIYSTVSIGFKLIYLLPETRILARLPSSITNSADNTKFRERSRSGCKSSLWGI